MVATSATTYLVTADELDGFPNDGKRREIIEGILSVAAAPSRLHQKVLYRLTLLIGNLVEHTQTGEMYFAPVNVRFSDRDVVQPDLMYIRRERIHMYQGNTIHGAPDVVIEVVSPSNRGYDLVEKARLYEANHVPEHWIFDPDHRTVRQLVLRDGVHVAVSPEDGLYRSTVIDGLVIGPEKIFAPLDE